MNVTIAKISYSPAFFLKTPKIFLVYARSYYIILAITENFYQAKQRKSNNLILP